MIRALLQKPYALGGSLPLRLWRSAAIGLFVFLFLWFFKPFGLNTLPKGLFVATLGYGLITFAIMGVMALAMQLLPASYYNEERWTVGKEVTWTLLHIAMIGVANLLYSDALGMVSVSSATVIWFLGYALGVGIFPTAAIILANEARLNKVYAESSAAINRNMHAIPHPGFKKNNPTIRIPAETKDGSLDLLAEDLWYVAAADNYIQVYFLENGHLRKQLIRASLKTVEQALAAYPQFLRCHKGYIVNLHKVEEVQGNAQGYKLRLQDYDLLIPVSRALNQTLRERLTVRP